MKRKIIDVEATGKRIKEMIKAKNIKVSEIQRTMGFSTPQAIYRWFSAKYTSLPSLDNIVLLSRVLRCTIDELIVTRDVDY